MPAEYIILIVLVIANGIVSMAETAVVSSRKTRLQERADKGDERARRALGLMSHPQRFLALVQFWLTLSGMIAGVLGGVRLAEPFEAWLQSHWAAWPFLAEYSRAVALVLVTTGLTFFMLIFGELVPKRIAIAYPERVAALLTGSMEVLAWLAAPFLKVTELATNGILALIRFRPPAQAAEVGMEEVRALIEQGLHAGSVNQVEHQMVTGVLELDELPVTALMTPRPKIVFLNIDDSDDVNWRKIVASGHSRFPVYQSTRDHVVGTVAVKAIWANSAFGLPANLRTVVAPALTVPESLTAVQLLEQFKKTGQHLALVLDEFGAVQGLVTLLDVLTAIVGDLPERGRRNQPEVRRREDGSWLADATLSVAELKTMLGLTALPGEEEANYQTVAGFVMTQFGRVPIAGDYFDFSGWRFEVVDMDRHRIDKVLIGKVPAAPGLQQAAG